MTTMPFWLLSGHWEMRREVGEKTGVRVCTAFLPGCGLAPTEAPLQGPLTPIPLHPAPLCGTLRGYPA